MKLHDLVILDIMYFLLHRYYFLLLNYHINIYLLNPELPRAAFGLRLGCVLQPSPYLGQFSTDFHNSKHAVLQIYVLSRCFASFMTIGRVLAAHSSRSPKKYRCCMLSTNKWGRKSRLAKKWLNQKLIFRKCCQDSFYCKFCADFNGEETWWLR